MKVLAKEINVPLVALAQLSCVKKRPTLADLREFHPRQVFAEIAAAPTRDDGEEIFFGGIRVF